MKTFLKLIAAVFVFGFASANAATYADLAAAKAAVVAAVTAAQSGNESDLDDLKDAIAAAVGQFPESAGDIVKAGLNTTGATNAIQTLIVRVAAWIAPQNVNDIITNGINASNSTIKANLIAVANRVAGFANAAGAPGARATLPPITAS